jgi:hypothetical protein
MRILIILQLLKYISILEINDVVVILSERNKIINLSIKNQSSVCENDRQ